MSVVGVRALDVEATTGPAQPGRVVASSRFVARVLLWMLILAALAALAAGVLVPRIAGATPYTILTGSMTPTYPPGTLVVDRPVDPDDVSIGMAVTYQLASGQAQVVTHRVIAISTNLNGERTFTFKGDANSAPDAAQVRPEQIRGRVWYAVPYLGRANVLFTGHERQLAVYGVAGALGVYALGMFVGSVRDRRRRAR